MPANHASGLMPAKADTPDRANAPSGTLREGSGMTVSRLLLVVPGLLPREPLVAACTVTGGVVWVWRGRRECCACVGVPPSPAVLPLTALMLHVRLVAGLTGTNGLLCSAATPAGTAVGLVVSLQGPAVRCQCVL